MCLLVIDFSWHCTLTCASCLNKLLLVCFFPSLHTNFKSFTIPWGILLKQFHISLVQMLDLPFTYHLPIYLKNCKEFTFSLYSIVSLYSFLLFFIFNVENDSNNAFILFLASKKFPFASQKWLLQNLHIHSRFSNYYLAKPDAANHLQVAKLSLACAKQL